VQEPKKGHGLERIVFEVIEPTMHANGPLLCVREVEGATGWSNVDATREATLPTCPEPGTMEPSDSEYKTDLE